MRPQIPQHLAERIEAIYEQAGYGTEAELVRDAVRRWVSELEEEFSDQDRFDNADFEYNVESSSEDITIYLYPGDTLGSWIGYQYEDTKTRFDTGTTEIEFTTFTTALESIDEVFGANLVYPNGSQQQPAISVGIPRDEEIDVDNAVSEIFETVVDIIREKEDPVTEVERAASKYAVRKEDES